MSSTCSQIDSLLSHLSKYESNPKPEDDAKKSHLKSLQETKSKSTEEDDSKVPENWDNAAIANETCTLRFSECNTPYFGIWLDLEMILFKKQSEFQDVRIIETKQFGRQLILDMKTQSAEKDEYLYHESLTHPAMLIHPCPKRVFIGGAGELATARETLKYKSVERVVLCDLDKVVVDACIEFLPQMSRAAKADKRLEIIIADAKQTLEQSTETWDVVIMDIADPIEAGPGIACYFQSFYQQIYDKLSDNGVFVTQSGPGGFVGHQECATTIYNTVKSVFPHTYLYTQEVPSYGQDWAFTIGIKLPKDKDIPAMKDWTFVDKEISKRFNGDSTLIKNTFRHYDGQSHSGMFSLPKHIRNSLENETRVMTKDTPVFMF
ncbi:hypothetical protein RFI_03926 [Reticulomyxa filosa]|uniref:thermospermine synthase n=1 Tax=Reticulomyxa filosa TaxID=46433 RepID=X6P6D7_RETFI|nr:hypothetical protein RFI_03926 [Reticulomyxa filosa]|eukprot:ETO33182.1 hypothetical protein RFI_03926 [Reticulomyxa filosa]